MYMLKKIFKTLRNCFNAPFSLAFFIVAFIAILSFNFIVKLTNTTVYGESITQYLPFLAIMLIISFIFSNEKLNKLFIVITIIIWIVLVMIIIF